MKKIALLVIVCALFQCRSFDYIDTSSRPLPQESQIPTDSPILDSSSVQPLEDNQTQSELIVAAIFTENDCLGDQDLNQPNVDISNCPAIPEYPEDAYDYPLGAWELGQTREGEVYKYGDLTAADQNPRKLQYSGGETAVDQTNKRWQASDGHRSRDDQISNAT